MNKKNPLLKGAAILTFAGLFSRMLGFLYRIFLSNLIGAEGMGIFQLISPVFILCVSMSSGGIQIAVSRFVAESSNNVRKCFLVLRASLIMSLAMSILTAGLMYFFATPISAHILGDLRCVPLLKYISFAVPLSAFHSCIVGYYLGLKKTGVPAWAQIFEQIFKLASLYVISIVYIGNGYELNADIAVYTAIISELIGALFLLTAVHTSKKTAYGKVYNASSLKVSLNNRIQICITDTAVSIKQLFSVAYVLTLNKIMLTFLQSLEAVIIPGVLIKYGLSNSDSLIIYGILTGMALPMISFPSAIITSLSMMLMPAIAEANVSNQSGSLKHTTEVTVWFSSVCGIFCTGLFLFYGDFIGLDVFGQELASSYIKSLSWLCPFMYLSITLGSVLHGLGKTTVAFFHNLASTVIRLAFLWFIVPSIGITGYFWGLLVSMLVTTFLHAYVIAREINFVYSAYDCIIKPALWLLLSLGAGTVLKNICNRMLTGLSLPHLASSILEAFICGLAIFIIFGYFMLRHLKVNRASSA